MVRSAIDVVLDRWEEINGSEFVVRHDFFWSIDDMQRVDPYVTPDSFTIGQLAEVLESLQRLVDEPDSVTPRHAVWIGELLETAAEVPMW
jgi:hypothetical protein